MKWPNCWWQCRRSQWAVVLWIAVPSFLIKPFKRFFKLLFRWKGSVWKLVYVEVGVWLVATIIWLFIYDFLSKESVLFKKTCNKFILEIIVTYNFNTSVTLLIGFTSSLVLSRWLDIYRLLAWPDNLCQMFNSYFIDAALTQFESRLLRQNIARYLTLSYVLLLKDISYKIRKKYPDDQKLIASRLASQEDMDKLNESGLNPGMCHYWVPLTWIITHLKKHYHAGVRNITVTEEPLSVMSEQHYCSFVTEIVRVRGLLGDLLAFDWVPIPLAIVQLNVIVCYVAMVHNIFAVSAPLAKENLSDKVIGVVVTLIVTLARIILYVGWLKCMGVVLNPFGADDDDFELEFYLTRHSQIINALLRAPIETLPDNCYPRMETHLAHTHFSAVNAITTQPEKRVTVQGSLRRRLKKKRGSGSRSESN